jgi:predicted RNA polymerase sigma factor
VLYLIFNEGYTATAGAELHDPELTAEAIRLARSLQALLPDDGEVAGLLALMLLTDARRAARTGPGGALIPLGEQDRSLWDRRSVDEGVRIISGALTRAPLGDYQLQAAIAAVHSEATTAQDTDWPQILALYELLEERGANPMVSLSRAVAVAMVSGPRAALDVLASLDADGRLTRHHRLHAVRAHLLELAGDLEGAGVEYRAAALLTTSRPEQQYLRERADRLSTDPGGRPS